ncbi:hypothetical protein [Maridesulfovibrio frigidus]|uniref:hypothetical protein n=1 Tax=Maridesulfovibrio frigidus TaxID=340956 RepID=UPI0004E259DF|nr:hypothetical protein [Maridesulfovibrio frigidus]
MKKYIIFAALLIILGGCTSWHNDNISDPKLKKESYKEDREFCTKRTGQRTNVGPSNENGQRELTRNSDKFSDNRKATSTYNDCMQSRGWVKK